MRLRFFTVPVHATEDAATELNQFLAAHRVLAIDRQLVADGANSAWAICVSFDDGAGPSSARAALNRRGKVDFKDVLTEAEFAVFARLRALRKETADAEGVPAYAVFTNEQLAEIVRLRVTSAATLREVAGVGPARADKYGAAFLAIIEAATLPALPQSADET
jgi:superfamily II DNA helicase RecQ